jgi:hypothetical protein
MVRHAPLKSALVALVCISAYLFPYFYLQGWWRFVPSTGIIFGSAFLAFGDDAKSLLGVDIARRDLMLSLALFAVALPTAYLAMYVVLVDETLVVHRALTPRSQAHQFFQVFNDEIMMRAALLTIAIRLLPYPKAMILGLSLLFALGHRVFYAVEGIEIGAPALASLFAFGVTLNALFVRFRHIGYGVALHYAWNFWRINATYYTNGEPLPEGATFNLIEGNAWIVSVSMTAMLMVVTSYIRWERSRSREFDA